MILYIAPIALIIFSNVFYHISQKKTSLSANPFVALVVTYLTALVLTALMIPFWNRPKSLAEGLSGINWTSFGLGVAIVGLELGFLLAYRSGWNINIALLLASTIVAILLIPVGFYFFKESVGISKIAGISLCLGGLFLIGKK